MNVIISRVIDIKENCVEVRFCFKIPFEHTFRKTIPNLIPSCVMGI